MSPDSILFMDGTYNQESILPWYGGLLILLVSIAVLIYLRKISRFIDRQKQGMNLDVAERSRPFPT